ncbi:MAG: hypothetical protein JO217_07195 [Acidobacteriaceae bacterium]|nr:hypothetical protein [Acidobacteriaceae bacterium]
MAVHWMEKAFSKNKGGLHRATYTPAGETIPVKKVYKAARSSDPHVERVARAALNARKSYGK